MTTTAYQPVSAMLGLRAQTSIHAGAGQQTGVIDLPVQREGHTGWPCIFGSSVKGALRSHAEQQQLALVTANGALLNDDEYRKQVLENDVIAVIFGPHTQKASEHAGALMVSDARMLLFPVRSLTTQFKWVTSPEALSRYDQDCQRLGLDGITKPMSSVVQEIELATDKAIVPEETDGDDLFLEEFRFGTDKQDLTLLIDALALLMAGSRDIEVCKSALRKQLVVVSDDTLTLLAHHATPVNPHISLDSQTKANRNNALWYEETLPPETLLYVGMGTHNPRKHTLASDSAHLLNNAQAILNTVLQAFSQRPWLQIGGNETVGMGWCAVKVVKEEE